MYCTSCGSELVKDAPCVCKEKASLLSGAPTAGREAFQEGWRDVPFIFLFVLNMAVIIGITIVYGDKIGLTKDTGSFLVTVLKAMDHFFVMIALCAAVSLVYSMVYTFALSQKASVVVPVTLFLSPICVVLVGLTYLWLASQYGGYGEGYLIISICIAAVMVLLIWLWRDRIPFATTMLSAASVMVGRYPSMVALSAVAIVIQISWMVVWLISFISGIIMLVEHDWVSFESVVSLIVYYWFSHYWTSQLVTNIVHMACAGTFSAWYYSRGQSTSNPMWHGFRRAITTSLGSVIFASVVVAIIKSIRVVISIFVDGWCRCCLRFVARAFDRLMQRYNLYALTQCATYGKSYWSAVKDTATLLRQDGVDMIANDALTATVLEFGAFLGGVISGVVGALYLFFWIGKDFSDNDFAVQSIFVLGGLIGYQVGSSLASKGLAITQSGVATLYVCYAEDPEVLRDTDAALHEALHREKTRLNREGPRV